MKTIIAGSRDIEDYDLVLSIIHESGAAELISEVLCGMARGVDTQGFKWAIKNKIPTRNFPADWDKYGKGAGAIRNGDMADCADIAIIVWDGESRGTRNMIEQMQKRDKPAFVYNARVGYGKWTMPVAKEMA